MNEASFFNSRNNFDAPTGGRTDPFEKCSRISSVAQCAGGDDSHCVSTGFLSRAMKAAKDLYGESDGLRGKKSAAENRLAQAGDFAIFMDFDEVVRS